MVRSLRSARRDIAFSLHQIKSPCASYSFYLRKLRQRGQQPETHVYIRRRFVNSPSTFFMSFTRRVQHLFFEVGMAEDAEVVMDMPE